MRMATRAALGICLLILALPAIAQQQVRVIPKGSVTVPTGQTTADIPVVIQGDTVVEPDEGYTVTISSPTLQLGTATASGTIINDDGIVAPVLSVSAPARVKNGAVANFTVTRAGDKSKADKVQWAIVPVGSTPADEADFPAVLEDTFSGSALGSDWCAADGSSATYEAPDGCPGIPEDAQYGLWEADRVSVTGGNLRLSIDYDAGDWTAAQVFSKRAFFGGHLEYGVTFPAGKGGAHAIWRSPEDQYYGPGPRSGQIVDVAYFGKEAGQRNKTWLSQLQYSGADSDAFPAISGLLNDGTVWSGVSRAGVTRWRVGTDGVMRFSFRLGNTEYWAPIQGDWPATQPWTRQDEDEDGTPVLTEFPGGGPQSPFDRPFRIVMQSGVGDADSAACSGETDCPDTTVLDGATVLVDYVRLYQYPNGEAILQPGQDQITIPVQTRDAAVAGVRNFRLVLMSADEATISAANGTADVALDPVGTVGIDHGKETYFLDFGLNAGGFTDSFGTTWQNGNSFVTGGTAINDTVTGSGGNVGGWTTSLIEPPTLTNPLIVENKCIGEAGWPTQAQQAGRDVRIIFPTDRTCVLPQPTAGNMSMGSDVYFGGTKTNPANNMWITGGHFVPPPPTPETNASAKGYPSGPTFRWIKGTALWEGFHVDMKCTCRDAVALTTLGFYENGATLKGNQPDNKTPKIILQNGILTDPLQCGGSGANHGDIVHSQGDILGSTRPNLTLQNMVIRGGFQQLFLDNSSSQSQVGHGVNKLTLDHVVARKAPSSCSRIPNPGDNFVALWNVAPVEGVWFYNTWFDFQTGWTTAPAPSGFSGNCATYAASAGVRTSGWCRGPNPKGDPVTPANVGRNYSRSYFTGGSAQPPTIAGARVPRLDHTRLTGSTMQIAIPVNTLRGRQRLVTLGFSARSETAAGQRTFDIAGNIVRKGFDIYANAGARDTETRITAPVTIGEDGYLRLTLTGVTGQAQINWMSIQRPTISVTLDKSAYVEGDTVTATLRRSGPTEPAVSMGWQVQGVGDAPTTASDFDQEPSGTAFWSAGDVDKQASFKIRQDGAGEPQESFAFSLSGGTGADVDPALSSVTATIAASSGPADPCAPGGPLYPCDTGGGGGGGDTGGGGDGGGGGGEDPTDVCRPEGVLTGKPIRIEAGKAIAVRKTHLVSGLNGVMRGLQTKCSKSKVCYGRDACQDPKGLQPDVLSTAFVRIDTAGAFPDLKPGERVQDSFVYQVCATAVSTNCTPVIADIVITAPLGNTPPPPPPPADTEAPSTPSSLTADAVSASQIDLTWQASTDNVGVAGYRVFRCAGSGCAPLATPAATTASTTYANIGLSAQVYGFRVAAFDAAGNVSPVSATVYAAWTPPATTDGIRADAIPFVQPDRATLQASSKKIVAHWHQFPISRSKGGPDGDWYATQFSKGRLRPLPRPARTTAGDVEWKIEDALADMRQARQSGVDAFLINIYRTDMTNPWAWPTINYMLKAAARDNKGFKIAPNFDCSYGGDAAQGTAMANQYVDYLGTIGETGSTHLMKIGANYVAGSYWTNNCQPAHWEAFKTRMSERGFPTHLICTFQGGGYRAEYDTACDSWSDWGERSADQALNRDWRARYAGVTGEPIAGVVSHGDTRYNENDAGHDWSTSEQRGFGTLRNTWLSVIQGAGADWAHLVTWNDIGEHSHMYPNTAGQWAFYDLNAYYAAWFKTGTAPPINKDAIYYSHRIAQTPSGTDMRLRHQPWANVVDVMAFLTAPATVEIITAAGTTSQAFGAGLQTMTAPLPTSGKPRIRIVRNGQPVVNTESQFTVGPMPAEHDVVYRAGGSLRTSLGQVAPSATVCATSDPDTCLTTPGEPVWKKEN